MSSANMSSAATSVAELRLVREEPRRLEALIAANWRPLVRYAASILGGEDGAEDIVQDALARLWRRSPDMAAEDAKRLLYRIVRNLGINEARRRRIGSLIGVEWARRRRSPATPLEETETGELAAALKIALQALTPRRREVFVLARDHGMTHREIADVTGMRPQTVANHLTAALAELRVALAPFADEVPGPLHRRRPGRHPA